MGVSVILEFFFVGAVPKVPVSLGLEVALGELGLDELLGGGGGKEEETLRLLDDRMRASPESRCVRAGRMAMMQHPLTSPTNLAGIDEIVTSSPNVQGEAENESRGGREDEQGRDCRRGKASCKMLLVRSIP